MCTDRVWSSIKGRDKKDFHTIAYSSGSQTWGSIRNSWGPDKGQGISPISRKYFYQVPPGDSDMHQSLIATGLEHHQTGREWTLKYFKNRCG